MIPNIPDSPYANFNRIKTYDASGWRQSLEALEKRTPDCWDIFVERQAVATSHQMTKNIPLIWNEQESSLYHVFEHLIEPLKTTLEDIYGQGHIRKLFITKQFPKTIIFPHRDTHDLFRDCHRCHIVLHTGNTNKYGIVLFYIGYIDYDDHTRFKTEITKRWIAETVPMCVDEMWEINNYASDKNLQHNVVNYSYDVDKIHIIMDWKQDPFISSFHKKPLDRDRETIV